MKTILATLRRPTRAWVERLDHEYELDDSHRRLIFLAAGAWDRVLSARETLAKEGLFLRDRFSQQREHPALTTERQGMITYLRLMREVGLDLEPPGEVRAPRQYGA